MEKQRKTELPASFYYWQNVHKQKEQRRINALKQGKLAPYGYYIDKVQAQPTVPEQPINDIPIKQYLSQYKLEITYIQANQLISEGAETINLIIFDRGKYYLTYKNALKLPSNTFIRDINRTMTIFRKKHFIKLF